MTRVEGAKNFFRRKLFWLFCLSVVLMSVSGVKPPDGDVVGIIDHAHSYLALAAPYLRELGKLLFGAVMVAAIVDYTLTKDRIELEEKEAATREREKEKLFEEREALKSQLADERAEQKRQLQNELTLLHQQNAKNVLSSVYQRLIPEAAFKEIESILLNARLERRNYRIGITLRDLEESNGMDQEELASYLGLVMYSSYRLYNLTDKEYDTKVEFGLEIPNEKKLQHLTRVKSILINNEERLDDEQVSRSKSDHTCDVSVPVQIPANGFIDVSMEGESVKRRIDSEVWASIMPSDGVSVMIEGPEGLDIQCRPNHSKQFELRPSPAGINRKEFELRHGILPYQSIVAWWNGGDAETK